jgi:ABC-type spermidine/putrescine transport system permease subunit II
MNRQMPILLKPFVALTYVLLLAPLVVVVAVSFGASPNYEFPPMQLVEAPSVTNPSSSTSQAS